MSLFTADGFEGTLKDCAEGNLQWVSRAFLDTLPTWEGDKIFLKLVNNLDEPFFNLKLVYQGEKLISAEKDGASIAL